MTTRILLRIPSFIVCLFLAVSIIAEESQSDLTARKNDFDISSYTVVVENPEHYRHKSCLGVVYDSITVLVPGECGYRSSLSATDIVVYSGVDDFDEKINAIKTMRDLDLKVSGRKWVALYLESRLENKKPAKLAIPDLSCSQVWSCYYLATKDKRTLVNRRGVEMTPEVNSNGYSADYFYVLATSEHKPDEPWASFIPGAILFNARQEVVGFSLEEYSIYSLYLGDKHKFYRAHFSEDISRVFKKRNFDDL